MNFIRSIFRPPKRSTTIDDDNPDSFMQREQQCSESLRYAPLLGNAKMLGWELAKTSSDIRTVHVKYDYPCGVPVATIKISRKWCLSSSFSRSSTTGSALSASNVADVAANVLSPPGLNDAGKGTQLSQSHHAPSPVIPFSRPELLNQQPITDEPLEYANAPSAAVIPVYTSRSHANGPTVLRRQTSLFVNVPASAADPPRSSARIDGPPLLPIGSYRSDNPPAVLDSPVNFNVEYFRPKLKAAPFSVRFKGDGQRFTILNTIGSGTFASVVYARTDEGREVAIKIINKHKLLASKILRRNTSHELAYAHNKACADDIINELSALHLVTSRPNASPFLTSMLNAWTDRNNIYFVMRMCPFNLRQILKDNPLSPEQIRIWGAELLLGLEYLHSFGIIHRDLKPENILVTPSGHLVIADFGLAAVLPPHEHVLVNQCVGTPGYLAPEQHDGRIPHGGYSHQVDMYAYGLILMEMVLGDGKRWWSSFDHEHKMSMAYQRSQPTPFDVMQRVDAKDWLAGLLIRRLVQDNPQDRPTWVDVRTFGFFNDIDWTRLAERKYRVFQTPCVLPHAREHFKPPDDGQRFFKETYTESERRYVENVLEMQRVELQGLDALVFDYEYPRMLWEDSEHGVTCLQGMCHHGHIREL